MLSYVKFPHEVAIYFQCAWLFIDQPIGFDAVRSPLVTITDPHMIEKSAETLL